MANRDVVLFAVDYSGSTSRSRDYWSRVDPILKEYVEKYNECEIEYVLWDTTCKRVSYNDMVSNIRDMKGYGGTAPSSLCSLMIDNHASWNIKHVCIITDGQIGMDEVQSCDALLSAVPNMLQSVEACLFGSYALNLSVMAPFGRSAVFRIRVNDSVIADGDAREPIEKSGVLDGIKTPEDFLTQLESLRQVIVVQNLGRTNETLRDELLKLQKRLFAYIAEINAKEKSNGDILDIVIAGRYDHAVTATRSLICEIDDSLPGKIQTAIGELVDACTRRSFSLDGLRSNRAGRAATAVNVGIVPLAQQEETPEICDGTQEKFECPIMLDVDVPCLLISDRGNDETTARFVLDGAEPAVLDNITNCPLNLLLYPELVASLVSRIDNVIGGTAFGKIYLSNNSEIRSPYSRRALLGCLPLGAHSQHVRLGNWIISHTMSRGLLLGNPHLWVATLYLVIQRHVPRLAENISFMTAFCEHLKHRLSNYKTNISLSGLPEYPLLRAPIAVGLWYCLAGSTTMFANDPVHYSQERLRQFYPVADGMIELVSNVLGLSFPKELIETRIKVLRVFGYLMSRKLDMTALRTDIRRLYQNHVVLDDTESWEWGVAYQIVATPANKNTETTTIFLDGAASSDLIRASPLAWLTELLPLPQILSIYSQVSPSKKFGDVYLNPTTIEGGIEPVIVNGYNYKAADDDQETPICPATLRPYLIDSRDGLFWEDRARKVYGELDEILSSYNYFLDYVATRKAYPYSRRAFLAYVAGKQERRVNNPKTTLPSQAVAFADDVFSSYIEAFRVRGGVPSVEEFVRITEESRDKVRRAEMERLYRGRFDADVNGS